MNTFGFDNLTHSLTLKPKNLFLMDGIGAVLSSSFAILIFLYFNDLIGMPHEVLLFAIYIACLFAFYSATCFLFLKKFRPVFLKIIITGNALYFCLMTFVIALNYSQLTSLGVAYFVME